MKNRQYRIAILALVLGLHSTISASAMDAPGSGGSNWRYSQKDYHWYYYDSEKQVHTGWLLYEGEWYWFDGEGRMTAGGYTAVDGVRYYFYSNGHMAWNQYIGMNFLNQDGQEDSTHDIRVVGSESPTSEDRNLLTDYLYEIPRSWFDRFAESGWELMFYKKKEYFEAPATDGDIYYVYHSVDTRYKKVKFTDADSATEAFGEYVGYAAHCYRAGNEYMQQLWNDFPTLRNLLEIPSYYADDAQFYFGKVFAGYLDDQLREDMIRNAPETCKVMEEILHLNDDEETKARLKAKAEAEQKAASERAARVAAEEGYGPGVKKPEESEPEGETGKEAEDQSSASSSHTR